MYCYIQSDVKILSEEVLHILPVLKVPYSIIFKSLFFILGYSLAALYDELSKKKKKNSL